MKLWNSWKYHNLTICFFSIILAVFLFRSEVFNSFLLNIGNYGYLGAFIAGALFVSTFTVVIGAIILADLSTKLPLLQLGLLASLGAMFSNLIMIELVKDDIWVELKPILENLEGKSLKHFFHAMLNTKHFRWIMPILGAFMIASPLPDELGVILLGLSKINPFFFALLSFVLHSLGIFAIISISLI